MDVVNRKPLRVIFFRFFIGILVVFISVGILNVLIYLGIISSGALRPANHTEREILKVYDKLKEGEISKERIPAYVEYMLFDREYNIIKTSIAQWDHEIVKKIAKGGLKSDGSDYFFHISRNDGYLSLRYTYTVRYKSEWMNRHLPSPFWVSLVLYVIECIIGFIIITVIFSRKIESEMEGLISSAEKIQSGDLDFKCGESHIKEIHRVICSFEKMKGGLRESLNEQWEQQHKKREDIGALAHDIKTPMTIIRGNAELMEETELSEEQQEYNDYIIESSKEIENYIDMLIKTANDEVYKEHQLLEIHIEEFSEEIKNVADAIMGNKGKVNFENCVQNGYIKINKERVMRAVKNIILNGIQHSVKSEKEESYIWIKIHEDEDRFFIDVKDNGDGFSNEDLKRGREKFYMSDKSRGAKNHGMGLYISDMIIRDHRGKITLTNWSGGGHVRITLPGIKLVNKEFLI